MLIVQAPSKILDPLPRVRVPTVAVGVLLYSVRAGHLIRADTTRGPRSWTCQWLHCSRHPQCTVELADDDLATALDPRTLADTGHPDPTSQLITYLAAWRSQAWQRLGSGAGAIADRLAEEAGPDAVVYLDRDLYRSYALQVHMLLSGFENTLARLTRTALLTSVTDDHSDRLGVALTLPPTRISVSA